MIRIRDEIKPADLGPALRRFWELSARKIDAFARRLKPGDGSPVFTIEGRYFSRAWTDWTDGFVHGSPLIQFDATGEARFLEMGRAATRARMLNHVTHFGVHDHGFNNVSTFGNLWRLMNEGRLAENEWERGYYELALRASGAVQARRWTTIQGGGFIHSFNGSQSLFADTMRSLRSLALAHRFGQVLCGEQDVRISLLRRLVEHASATAKFSVYYGEGRDHYDVRGRVAHESIFNVEGGSYRCPSTQQGYSPFSTWTRALAWVLLGFAEQLEFLDTCADEELAPIGGRARIHGTMLKAARATADYYLESSPCDGIPYWDTGAPGLRELGDHRGRPADPFNALEPVDSSAATIACQGLMRLGRHLSGRDGDRSGREDQESGRKYVQAGLTVLAALLEEPYLSIDPGHEGLILHAVYHRPNDWDHRPQGSAVPRGESCIFGDYHAREAALYVQRWIDAKAELKFFG